MLHRLIETSPDITNCLANFSDVIKGIGQIILTKSEDLKLVAGMVIREMMLTGMQHACFWPTDAISSAIADFPTHDSQHWMEKFQDFLDDLHALRFIENNGDKDPGVLYAFEIVAEDSVHITKETGLIVLLVEGGNLTCVAPPSRTRIAQCFDIPLAHVTNVGVSKSTVRTIRGSQTEYTTAALTLDLRSQSWTYLCNAKEYHSPKFLILCRNLSEAQEVRLMIMEGKGISNSQAANNFGPKISASQTIDISKPPEPGDKIEQNIDVQPAHEKPTKKPTMSQTKRKKAANVQHSEIQSLVNQAAKGIAPQVDSPRTKKTTRPSIVKEPQLAQKSRTPTSGVLSQVTKSRRLDASGSTSVLEDHGNERDEFEVPLSPERPHKSMLKKPTPNKTKKDVIATDDTGGTNTSNHSIASQKREKQEAKKPKTVGARPNVRHLLQVEDTEASGLESSQLLSQRAVKDTETRHNVSQGASRIMQGKSSGNKAQENQKFLKSIVGSKAVKITKGKYSSDGNNNKNSVFDIPLDEPREPRKRTKRLVVKHIHSESRESTGESDQSEYIEPKRKPKPSTKKASTTKGKPIPKPTASANSKARNKKNQAKGQKAATQPVLSTRPSLVNKLLTGNRSQGEREQQAPSDSREASEAGDVQDDGVVLQSDPPPGLQTLPSHSKPTKAFSILKRPAEAPHPSTPEPKRLMVAKIIQHTNEDVVEGGVDSRTRSIVDFANKPGSVRVRETGSPCPIAKFVTEKSSAKQMIRRLLESMPAEEEAHGSHGSGHLTHSEEVALHSKDLLRPDRRESKTTPVYAQSRNSKALPAPPAAASRAISGLVTDAVVEKAKVNADKVKAASDPFKNLPNEQPQRPRTAFTKLLTDQVEKHAQEDHAQMLPSQDSLPLPATLVPRQQVNTNDDLDETLVGTEDVEYLPAKASPMTMVSSPLPSSHSSSSAIQVFEKIDTESAEEMEWEASLQPHQRAVADMLTRISRVSPLTFLRFVSTNTRAPP